jgi:hypothetical protein
VSFKREGELKTFLNRQKQKWFITTFRPVLKKKKCPSCWVTWCTLLVPAIREAKAGEPLEIEFGTSLGNTARTCLKTKKGRGQRGEGRKKGRSFKVK